MKIASSIIYAFACLLLFTHTSTAKEILVTNPQKLQDRADSLKPGDTLILADGEWNDIHLILNNQGTAEAPINVRAETRGKVTITGSSRIAIGGSHITVDGFHFLNTEGIQFKNFEKYIGPQPKSDEEVSALVDFIGGSEQYATNSRLTNCYFESCNPEETRRYHWVRIWGLRNRVDHCRFEGQDHRGVTVQVRLVLPDAAHRIDHNYFYDRKMAQENGYEGIQIGQSWASLNRAACIVENNIFEEYNGETEIISSKTCDNIIRNNLFLRSRGTLTIRHGNRTTADSNVFISDGEALSGGIRIIGEEHTVTNNYFLESNSFDGGVITLYCGIPDGPINGYAASHRATIANNVIVNPNGNAFYLNGGFGSRNRTILADEVRIQENVIVHRSDFGNVTLAGDLDNVHLKGNIYDGKAFGRPDSTGFTSKKLSLGNNDTDLPTIIDDETGNALDIKIPAIPTYNEVGPEWISAKG